MRNHGFLMASFIVSSLAVPAQLWAEASCTRTTGTIYQEYDSSNCHDGLIARPWVKYLCEDGTYYMYWSAPSWETKPKCDTRHAAE